MTIDKRISYDYVEQDGVNNYIKNSKSVTVPKEFKARKDAPATKLAYITADEAKMLKKKKPGTPHKGPKGIPSYDSFDAQGNFTSGAAMSAAETGSGSARDRAEVRASNIGAPSGAGPGVRSQQEQDLRSSFIAAGAGQRVNPGFFDSRNVVSPAELARARAFNPAAFSAGRRGGIMDFFTGGGFLGNIIRGLGQKFGLGKRFDEPTYDMRRFSGLPLGGSAAFQNLDIRDKFDRRFQDTTNQIPVVIDNDMSLVPDRGLTVAPGDGITTIPIGPMDTPQDQSMDDFYKDAMAEVTQKDIDASKARGFKMLDRDTAVTLGLISPNVTEYEFEQLKQGNITEPGTYTA